jgi:hypothetical protein
MTKWQERFESELQRGEQARLEGNEGMARVCARRAAGVVVNEYLQRRGGEQRSLSAYDHLRALAALPGIEPDVLEAVERLLVRITPEHTLPVDADLLSEARRLRSRLLGE